MKERQAQETDSQKRYSAIPPIVWKTSFSAYLTRLASENGVYLQDVIFNVAQNELRTVYTSLVSNLDIYPRHSIDVETLERLTEVTKRDLVKMSFGEAVQKFPSIPTSDNPISARISPLIEKKNRRFCPLCLKHNGRFKLLWQVQEILMCDQHRVRLQHHCEFCGAPQKFASQSLIIEGKCEVCGSDLSQSDVLLVGHHEAERQERCYRDWVFLTEETLDEDMVVLRSSQDELILAVLYHAQGRSQQFYKDSIRHLHPHFVSRLLWAMKVQYQRDTISVPKLLSFLRGARVELREFACTLVPTSYKESVYAYIKTQRKIPEADKCLAPWCRLYKKTTGMRILSRTKKRFEYNNEEFSELFVCTGCFCVYGHTMNSEEWKEISDVISLGYEQIRPHLNQLETHKGIRSISEAFGITKRRATRLTAYLVYYGLVDPSICRRFIPRDAPTDIADKFRHIDKLDGKQDDLAKEVYGWNLFEYFYFRSSPEVMHYLYFESKRDQKKSRYKKGHAQSLWEEKLTGYLEACEEQGVFPTTKTVSEAIGCSPSLLRSRGLLILISKTQQKMTPVYEEQLKKRVEEYLRITPANEVTRENCIVDPRNWTPDRRTVRVNYGYEKTILVLGCNSGHNESRM